MPYAFHPIEVATLVRDVGGVADKTVLCATLLHDVVEATAVDNAEIVREFGKRVGKLVAELTRREPPASQTVGMSADELWELRAAMLLEDISRMGRDAWTVKLADRVSNVREARRTKTPKKFARYLLQTDRILAVIPRSANPPLWDLLTAEARL